MSFWSRLKRLFSGGTMAGKKRKSGGRKCHCPKRTKGGKKVVARGGKCYSVAKKPVKKVCKGKGRKSGCPKGRVKRGPRKGRCRK